MNDPMFIQLNVQRAEGGCAFMPAEVTRIPQQNGHKATPAEFEEAVAQLQHVMMAALFGACSCSLRPIHVHEVVPPCPQHDQADEVAFTKLHEEDRDARDGRLCQVCWGKGVRAIAGCAGCGERPAEYAGEDE